MPYADYLYSMPDSDNEQPVDSQQDNFLRHGDLDPEELLHQADGYFHASSPSSWGQDVSQQQWLSSPTTSRPSNQVPRVPDVMVHDPSLRPGSTIEDKAIGLGRDVFNTAPARSQSQQESSAATDPTDARPSSLARALLVWSSSAADQDTVDDLYSHSPPVASSPPASPSFVTGQHQQPRACAEGQTTVTIGQPEAASATTATTAAAAAVASSHSSSTRSSGDPAPALDERRRPLIPDEAPPAYTPRSPTSSSATILTPNDNGSYNNTFAPLRTMGLQDETSPLLGNGNTAETAPRLPPAPNGTARHVSPNFVGQGKRKYRFLKVLVVALIVTAILCILLGIWDKEEWKPSPLPPNEPVHNPPRPPADRDMPKDSDGYPVRFPHGMCKSDTSYRIGTKSFAVSFSPEKSISVTERIQPREVQRGMQLGVYGHLAVRPYRGDDAGTGQITVDISSNLPTLDQDIGFIFSTSSQDLELILPRAVEWQDEMMPCAIINITLWVPPTPSRLGSLDANVVHLDVLLAEMLDLDMESMRLHTVVGDVDAASSRDSIDNAHTQGQPEQDVVSARPMPASYKLIPRAASSVGTVSGAIKGSFYLGEKLDLRTTNGDISVSVTPLDIAAKGELHVQTVRGDITVEEEGVKDGDKEKEIPSRDYETTMQTTSGHISARVAFGCLGSFETTSGDLKLELLPVVDRSSARQWMSLFTGTQSGDSKIEVLEPLFYDSMAGTRREVVNLGDVGDGDPYRILIPEDYYDDDNDNDSDNDDDEMEKEQEEIDAEGGGEGFCQLASKHKATSGDIKLMYPESWEGFVQLATHVGDIAVEGERLRIIKKQTNPGWGKVIVAVNGVDSPGEGSSVQASCMSGDVKFCVGKRC